MKWIAMAICLLMISVIGMVYGTATNVRFIVTFSGVIFVMALVLLIGAAKNYGEKLGKVVSFDKILLKKEEIYVVEATIKTFTYWPDFPYMRKEQVLVLLRSLSDDALHVCYTREVPQDFKVEIKNGKREYVPWYPSWST